MKPLRRIAWNGLAAMSALLCVATCVLWARSYWYVSSWESRRYWNADGQGHRDTAFAVSWHGGLGYDRRVLLDVDDSAKGYSVAKVYSVGQYGKRRDLRSEKWKNKSSFFPKTYGGFGIQHMKPFYADAPKVIENVWRIALPYWFVAALFALPPAGWLLAFRRAQRAAWRLRHTQCFQCGYDLRATRERCPECGSVPAI